jgi:nucleotidyltransferase/DNA polymerase involved in DNA repair
MGVEAGMRLSRAEKLCPTARFVPAREELYHAVHDTLVEAALTFTPTVETDRLGLVYAEVSGLERRLGPEGRLVDLVAREALRASGLDVRLGLGSGKFVALQAARASRSGEGCVVPAGEEAAFLSALPLSVLPADREIRQRLHLLGVRTLGALAALPRLAVVRQFGPQAGPLHDLARGIDRRPVQPDSPPLLLEGMAAFDEAVSDRKRLLAHAERMAVQLAETLSHQGYQAEGLRLRLEEEAGEKHTAAMPVKPPSASPGKLSRLVGRLLGELRPARPVDILSLLVYPVRLFHLGATQLTLLTRNSTQSGRQERLREALRRLRERFGEMIIVVASLIAPPAPRKIQVTTDPTGVPLALVWPDRFRRIELIHESWRERRSWWGCPVERDYFRVETADEQIRVVFLNRRDGQWHLERRHI